MNKSISILINLKVHTDITIGRNATKKSCVKVWLHWTSIWSIWIISFCLKRTIYVYTGSTIRNWHKVMTWLDQMLWQIYQKLMLIGFLSSGNLCLINHLKLFWPHAASTASDRKVAKIQHEFSRFCRKIIIFKTSK